MSSERNKVTAEHYDPLKHREQHIEMLKERVFQLNRWPHYELLLGDLIELASQREYDDYQRKVGKLAGLPTEGLKVLSLERTLLYGGKSLFAPIFYGHDYRIREASPETAYERGPYNEWMLDGRFMAYGKVASLQMDYDHDLCIIPNALHHWPIFESVYGGHGEFFKDYVSKVIRPDGYLYIFEQFIEEIHQKPDDHVRYTPDGLASLLQAAGYQIEYVRTTGNIFTSTCFLLDNILEYIEGGQPREGVSPLDHGMVKGEDIRRIQGMIKTLEKMAPNYPENGLRKHTECPKAFSILARKPN